MTKTKVYAIAKPLLTGAAATVFALLLLALLMLKLEWGSDRIEAVVTVVYGIACFLGGWSAGRQLGKKRFLAGLGFGVVYFVLLWFLSLAGGRKLEADGLKIGFSFGVCALAGMAGGMFSGFFK